MSPLSLSLLLWLNEKTIETCKVDKPTCAQVCGAWPDLNACKDVLPEPADDDLTFFVQMIVNLIAQANEPESSPGFKQAAARIPQLVWPKSGKVNRQNAGETRGPDGFADSEKSENFALHDMIAPALAVTSATPATVNPVKPVPQGTMLVPSLDTMAHVDPPKRQGSGDINTDIILGERSGGYTDEAYQRSSFAKTIPRIGIQKLQKPLDLKAYLPRRTIASVHGPGADLFQRIREKMIEKCRLGVLFDCH